MLDASEGSAQALAAAVELARALQAELHGIFFEDINLLRLAELPFVREIRLSSMTQEAIDLRRMESELRSLARQEQQRLEAMAHAHGLQYSFSVRRGQLRKELSSVVAEVEVLSLAKPVPQAARRLGYRTRRQEQPAVIGPLAVLFRGGSPDSRLLNTAARLAVRMDRPLVVMLPAADKPDRPLLRKSLESSVAPALLSVRFISLPDDPCDLPGLIDEQHATLLMASRDDPLLAGESLWQCLQHLSCPVVLTSD
jgi:hypothetical protein